MASLSSWLAYARIRLYKYLVCSIARASLHSSPHPAELRPSPKLEGHEFFVKWQCMRQVVGYDNVKNIIKVNQSHSYVHKCLFRDYSFVITIIPSRQPQTALNACIRLVCSADLPVQNLSCLELMGDLVSSPYLSVDCTMYSIAIITCTLHDVLRLVTMVHRGVS